MEHLHLLLCLLLIISSYFVAFSANPINSVISLIITFLNASILLYMFNVEFLGTIFIIIYVGAIAVLFLFVIMMLNIKTEESTFLTKNKIIKGFSIFVLYNLLLSLFLNFYDSTFSKEYYFVINNNLNVVTFLDDLSNIDVLGQVLFNYLPACILLAGLILLISLIGAIVLTLKFNNLQKNQIVSKQLAKNTNFLIFKKFHQI